MDSFVFELAYVVCAILFVLGIRKLGHPKTAAKGNLMAAFAMGLAIVVALFSPLEGGQNYLWILGAAILGSVVGLVSAKRVALTAMPEMVSLFNGVGGACALLISIVQLSHFSTGFGSYTLPLLITVILTNFFGGISFIGSIVAYLKLSGSLRKFRLPFNQFINLIMLVLFIYLSVDMCLADSISFDYQVLPLIILSLVYGFTFVVPVGGADMPVIISFLNSFTGLTSLLAGLIFQDQISILGGILVGSSGTILTVLMCKAMNRSLMNVLIGGMGASSGSSSSEDGDKTYKTGTVEDIAIVMNYAESVVFVPGYGMAVAQAQKVCKEIELALNEKGVEVRYAIHPVAGRMPGHMNVLLAEADVAYEKLMDLEAANDFLKQASVAIVVGANDVVNPAAAEKQDSPIYGMPILDLRPTANVVVIKRSMNTGYAGIDNDIFYRENTKMLFGDAKNVLQGLLAELKAM